MDLLQMVKAAKSATSDFGTFWTELYKITQNLPGVFTRFAYWDQDRLNAKSAGTKSVIVTNTGKAFKH